MIVNNVVLVEDDRELAMNLRELLASLGFNVSAIFDNAIGAQEFLRLNKVDLLILDIMIKGDMDGISLAREVKKKIDVPIVFITAYSENDVIRRVIDVSPDGHLLKPFSRESLKTTLLLSLSNYKKRLSSGAKKKKEETTIQIRDKGFISLIPTSEILYAQADGLYTRIFTVKKAFIIRDILKDFEARLDPSVFIRVHKSYLVNKNAIELFNGKVIQIKDYVIPIRRGFYKELRELVGSHRESKN
ncbi:LytR/AlgR family response regulator transcription factor [Mongoliibacter ruber]|uniref:DNA-binding LytR/AlgR family response regulator n=1 Tax=Mongoliibacter ruber TaxID=1750599 RepID=A0A2T0WPE2_9BACT|nr:response regulator transcription factor [Mongoliibacter ruber]PRY88569.1 DNA-binding LytR/AlgR family response regulator [Mongoliibacter ruber]